MAEKTLSRHRPLIASPFSVAEKPARTSGSNPNFSSTVVPALLLVLLLLLPGCPDRQNNQAPTEGGIIRLDNLVTLPVPSRETEFDMIRLAVAAILSPQGTVNSYRPLQAYMEQYFGKPVALVQRRTYQEVNELLARELVDVAFVCTGPFVTGRREGIMEMLVVPRIDGKITYQGQFIVLASSPIRTIHDLHGRSFALTDPMSNTGYRYPMGVIQAQGASAEQFFSQIIFTYSHDRSIYAVHDGIVDGASVDRIVYDNALRRDSALEDRFRIVHRSREYGIPPVVVPPRLSEEKKRQLKEFFLSIHEDPAGAKVLTRLGIERFVPGDPSLYY